ISWHFYQIMTDILYKEEVYTIIGYCMEVWRTLGYGFSEVVYKDAMELEFIEHNIPYLREEDLFVFYKTNKLKHRFRSDFTMYNKIIVEVKANEVATFSGHFEQTINYLRASDFRLGVIVNFGKKRLEYKRIIV
ncbi:MAG TPA: GxxExxY protein, partial [Chitinophagaceae bacterium]|nr:GxxExxY protein [Chitinophagaceae bacterium]HPN59408.1 GxxExxY protein [Chitinophagaceae bacterium]